MADITKNLLTEPIYIPFDTEYKSPIVQWEEVVRANFEDNCLEMVVKSGFDVNKDELAKALQYDRNQYEKGKKDGMEIAVREFIHWLIDKEFGGLGSVKIKGCEHTNSEGYRTLSWTINEIIDVFMKERTNYE